MNSRSGAVAQAGAGRDRLAHRRSAYAQFGGIVSLFYRGARRKPAAQDIPAQSGRNLFRNAAIDDRSYDLIPVLF
jgi:hypothetical protein